MRCSSNFCRFRPTEVATSNVRTPSTRLLSKTTLPAYLHSDRRPHSPSPSRLPNVSPTIPHLLASASFNAPPSHLPASASPSKPRTTSASKYDPTNGNRTVGPCGVMPRRSTTLYEKTSSTEKTNVLPPESKYVTAFPEVQHILGLGCYYPILHYF